MMRVLEKMGLNSYEREAVEYLAGVEYSDARDIYKATQIPSGRIYSVLNSLVSKGIVKMLPSKPKRYMIDDTKASLKQYIQKMEQNLDSLKNEADRIGDMPKRFSLEKSSSVRILTGKDQHFEAVMSFRMTAKKEILQMAPLFVGRFSTHLALQRALKRRIEARIIVRDLTKENNKNIKQATKEGADIRINKEVFSMMIKDREEAIIGVEDKSGKEERTVLYTRNKNLIKGLV